MAANLERRSASSTLSTASSGSAGACTAHGYPLRVRSSGGGPGSVSGGGASKRLAKKGDGQGVVRALSYTGSSGVCCIVSCHDYLQCKATKPSVSH